MKVNGNPNREMKFSTRSLIALALFAFPFAVSEIAEFIPNEHVVIFKASATQAAIAAHMVGVKASSEVVRKMKSYIY